MNYIIFDDLTYKQFLPMTNLRSISDLRCGILKLRQRIAFVFDFEAGNLIVNDYLIDLYKERHPEWVLNKTSKGETLFINSRIKINSNTKDKLEGLALNTVLMNQDEIIAFKINTEEKNSSVEDVCNLAKKCQTIETSEVTLWHYLWDLMEDNGEMIRFDYENVFYEEDNFVESEPGVTLLNPYDIWIGEGTQMKPGVIIDASEGPVVIDENATIMHNAVIIGPAYIGKNSVIKVAAKIYQNTSIGPTCKIGGEVEDTIIQAYSNKQHDGFLGHAYLGEWVNLGADTNNSDLKNTYKEVTVYSYVDGKKINTGSRFVGCFIGDHAKVGINCSINTGTVIGMGSNVYGSPLITDFIPDFSWGQANDLQEYRLEEFLTTTETVKSRRNLKLSETEKTLISKIYKTYK